MIVADYARPSALMVPHYGVTIIDTLEGIAAAAARWTGVILLSGDPERSHRFIERQPCPERFSVVGAEFDTGWIRDRSPIAIRRRGGYDWVLPRRPPSERERDDVLFERITARPLGTSPLFVPQGNLVAGPRGAVFSTTQVLRENGLAEETDLIPFSRALGVGKWVVFEPLEGEMSGHADMYLRFLRPNLMALGWPLYNARGQKTASAIETRAVAALPGLRILRIPVRARENAYASPLNWIQIGRELLVPRYPITPDEDLEHIAGLLAAAGFHAHFIESPTLAFGGSLHCMTASVYI